MKHARIAALLLALLPLQAQALDTTELLGIVAMPLAVAAAADVTGVPADDLSRLVATLNRAEVPPTQIVQVVRYAPVALVVEDPQTRFVEYVDTQVSQGVTGPQLVRVIDQRLRTYDVTPQFVALDEPATTFVVRDDYIPPAVITRVAQLQPATTIQPVVNDTNDLLALIALPLAVSAAAEATGVPLSELANLVAILNSGGVPPQQMIEVVRYAPVALVEEPQFVTYLRTRVDDGVTGPQLVQVIDQRLRTYDVEPQFARSEVEVVDDGFIPPIVRTRVAEARKHPHGGPPGQLKKQLGVQTGAEIVHGEKPGREFHRESKHEAKREAKREGKRNRVVIRDDRDRAPRVVERRRSSAPRVIVAQPADFGRGGPAMQPPGQAKKDGHGHGGGGGQGKGKGKGKG